MEVFILGQRIFVLLIRVILCFSLGPRADCSFGVVFNFLSQDLTVQSYVIIISWFVFVLRQMLVLCLDKGVEWLLGFRFHTPTKGVKCLFGLGSFGFCEQKPVQGDCDYRRQNKLSVCFVFVLFCVGLFCVQQRSRLFCVGFTRLKGVRSSNSLVTQTRNGNVLVSNYCVCDVGSQSNKQRGELFCVWATAQRM